MTNSIPKPERPIFALATPLGGAIAVMRVSGDGVRSILGDIFTGEIHHRTLSHGFIKDEGETLDEVMAVFFEAPHSYTGEDMFEIHIHAGLPIAEALSALLMKKGAHPAAPGEFTRRAFLNGKMDLTRAEAVMDVINSMAERGSKSAVRQLSGTVFEAIDSIETELLEVASFLEALIDYPDEMEDETESVRERINTALKMINAALSDGALSHRAAEGTSVVLLGKPNCGKSSLLNALTGEDCAIVTDIAGTTRDVIERSTRISSVPVTISDTAGLRDARDAVEQIGINRTLQTLERADMCIAVFDASRPFDAHDADTLARTHGRERVIVLNKCDLPQNIDESKFPNNELILKVSAKTGEGLDALRDAIAKSIHAGEEHGLITNSRHIKLLESAKTSLESALTAEDLDCTATDVRDALRSLDEIVGRNIDDAVLDSIFSRFCVGK